MTKGDLMITMEMVGVIKPKTLISIGTFATILFFGFLESAHMAIGATGSIVQVVILNNYHLKEVAFIWVQSQSNEQKEVLDHEEK
jgi:hypothetical protein